MRQGAAPFFSSRFNFKLSSLEEFNMFKMFRINLAGTKDVRQGVFAVMQDITLHAVTETDAVVTAVSLAIQEGYLLNPSCMPLVLYTPSGNLKHWQQPVPNMHFVGVWMVRLYDTVNSCFVHNVLTAKGETDAVQTSVAYLTHNGRRPMSDFKMSIALPLGELPERLDADRYDSDAFAILDNARKFLNTYMGVSAERTRETMALLPNS